MPSTVINHFHYYPETKTLRVTFVSGAVYDYKKVPRQVFEQMQQAGSRGKFLNERIKGNYAFEQVGPGPSE
jgi:hypothetical protein